MALLATMTDLSFLTADDIAKGFGNCIFHAPFIPRASKMFFKFSFYEKAPRPGVEPGTSR
jgi:hypothetical protein